MSNPPTSARIMAATEKSTLCYSGYRFTKLDGTVHEEFKEEGAGASEGEKSCQGLDLVNCHSRTVFQNEKGLPSLDFVRIPLQRIPYEANS
jgi:hypothetical protein